MHLSPITRAVALLTAALVSIGGVAAQPVRAEVVGNGTVDVVVVDRHEGQRADSAVRRLVRLGHSPAPLETRTFVNTGRGTVELPPALARGLRPGQRVSITTSRRARPLAWAQPEKDSGAGGSALASVVTEVEPVAASTEPIAAGQAGLPDAAGQHTLTVLPVYWASTDGRTQAGLSALAQQTAAYWAAQSAGAIEVATTVNAWARIADPGSCDPTVLFDRALAAHRQAAPSGRYQHVLVYFPTRSDCGGWAGLGSVLGSRIWVNGYPLVDVAAHELGHNFGLGHADRAICSATAAAPGVSGASGERVALSQSCQIQDYADSADVMGYATYAASGTLNSALADQIGLVRTVTATSSTPVDVELSPLTEASAVRAVKVNVGTGWVYLDFRPAQSPDLRRREWAGVQVHYLPSGSYPQSQLLDLQPWQGSPFTTTSMPAYSVWRVPGSSMAVSVVSVGQTARVRVVPVGTDTVAPTRSEVSPVRTSARTVDASWTPSGDAGAGLVGYRVVADGVPVGHAAPTATAASVTVPAAARSLRVDAVDAAGNVATGTAVDLPAGEPADDPLPAPPRITSPAPGLTTRSDVVDLLWTVGQTDTPPTGFRLYADGEALGTDLDAEDRGVQIELPEGRTTLAVTALDSSGRESARAQRSVVVDTTAPGAPRTLRVRPGTGLLSWTAPVDRGSALRYQVTLDGAAPVGTSLPRAPMAARPGRHTWTVRAVDAAGNRSPVVRLTATVDPSPPTAPRISGLGPVRAPDRPAGILRVTWRPAQDAQSGIARYEVRADGRLIARAPRGSRQVRIDARALPPGPVAISVRAVNGAGVRSPAATRRVVVR